MNTLDEMLLFCYNAIGFRMFCQKEKNFVLTKCKQKICNTKEERKKMKTTPYVLSIKQ